MRLVMPSALSTVDGSSCAYYGREGELGFDSVFMNPTTLLKEWLLPKILNPSERSKGGLRESGVPSPTGSDCHEIGRE
ncbi:hypothetical protein NPIL_677481 [Nephila pilipes]|uniref:Uncharacterized protein n=1 Tax=Nephila pilipes TaxID=299642 RepID=A0A8X6PFW5_NEPPI|nr:hypothetical protein NPIL_677481 [Nephila pilipes]